MLPNLFLAGYGAVDAGLDDGTKRIVAALFARSSVQIQRRCGVAWQTKKVAIWVLEEAGADIRATDPHGNNALHIAQNLDMDGTFLRHLFDMGLVDVINAQDDEGNTLLHDAARWGTVRSEFLRALLEHHPVLEFRNREGLTPLQVAVQALDGAVQPLLDAGANPRICDGNRRTLLHICRAKYIDALLAAGLGLEAADNEGKTALHEAVEWSSDERMDRLLEEGASIEARDRQGRTPLHYAAMSIHGSKVPKILVYCPEIDAVDQEGNTPLHLAAKAHNASAVRALLDAGADHRKANGAGHFPYQLSHTETECRRVFEIRDRA